MNRLNIKLWPLITDKRCAACLLANHIRMSNQMNEGERLPKRGLARGRQCESETPSNKLGDKRRENTDAIRQCRTRKFGARRRPSWVGAEPRCVMAVAQEATAFDRMTAIGVAG
jgi:hypothetical protein